MHLKKQKKVIHNDFFIVSYSPDGDADHVLKGAEGVVAAHPLQPLPYHLRVLPVLLLGGCRRSLLRRGPAVELQERGKSECRERDPGGRQAGEMEGDGKRGSVCVCACVCVCVCVCVKCVCVCMCVCVCVCRNTKRAVLTRIECLVAPDSEP